MVQLPNVTDYHVPYQKAVMNSTSDFERVIHEPDTNESDGHGEAVKVGANMIMTGVVMTFDHWGAGTGDYNTLRIWNWKPIRFRSST